jgi:hypothetical protein
VIDPTEIFCSFTGSTSDNWGYSATYDNAGNLYMGGIVLDETNGSGNSGSVAVASWSARGFPDDFPGFGQVWPRTAITNMMSGL